MASAKILEEKKAVVDEITNNIKNSESVLIFTYQGLTVSELNDLRRELVDKLIYARENNMTFIMERTENTLSVVGFYFGEPNEDDTEFYRYKDLTAVFAEEEND